MASNQFHLSISATWSTMNHVKESNSRGNEICDQFEGLRSRKLSKACCGWGLEGPRLNFPDLRRDAPRTAQPRFAARAYLSNDSVELQRNISMGKKQEITTAMQDHHQQRARDRIHFGNNSYPSFSETHETTALIHKNSECDIDLVSTQMLIASVN
jgi:hypothetical protein